jgi:ADP-ribose pyrophosphatase YjhB (NUDIX family)/DNA-binding HxlR family transcriptional regulator
MVKHSSPYIYIGETSFFIMKKSNDLLGEKIKARILEQLMHKDLLFSEIVKKSGLRDHGHLNYHLQLLVRQGLVVKEGQMYRASAMGERLGVYLKQFQMKEMYPISLVCAFVFNKSGELLLLRRAKNPQRGRWGLPGGKMVIGESLVQAAERELFEETGLKLKAVRALGFFPSRVYKSNELSYHVNIVPVLMKAFSEKDKISMDLEESSESCFVHPNKLSKMELVSNNLEMIRAACKNMDGELFSFQEISHKE